MKKARVKILRNIRWQIKNKLVLKDIKVQRIVKDNTTSNLKLLVAKSNKKIKRYIEEYNQYQEIKNRAKMLMEKLGLNLVLVKPWQYILIDFITTLLPSCQYQEVIIQFQQYMISFQKYYILQ